MKKSYILLALAVLMTVTSCDFMRRLAGRPTSEDIEVARLEILRIQKEAEVAAEQARLDSIKQVQKTLQDSLAVYDSLRQEVGSILNPAELGGLFSSKLEARYYVIVGAFRARANAERMVERISSEGEYAPALINFRNGMIAVGVCPRNKVQDAFAALKEVREESFCPNDVWILVNE